MPRPDAPPLSAASLRHGTLSLLAGLPDRTGGSLMAEGGVAIPAPLHDPAGNAASGWNFAAQDYLSLAGHPALRVAATAVLLHHRPGSADPVPQPGLTGPVLTLEDRIARFVQMPRAVVFPSGTEAIRATLRCTLREGDDVIVDAGAHPAMFETVVAARARVHRCPPGSVDAVERRLRRLSAGRGRLFVAVSAVSAQASVLADLAGLVDLCRSHAATLVVDVSHDLGAMAQGGGGVMEIQGCLGRIGIVIGSFAKCFGATGGFAAFHDPGLQQALRDACQGAALSAVNAAAILAALDIITSQQGRTRRRSLHSAALRLRNHLMADGIRVMGQPSPLVPIPLPVMTALPRTALMERAGVRVTLLTAPTVATHAPRWRLQLMADHGAADIDDLADLIRDVTRVFDRGGSLAREREALGQG